MGTTQVGSAVGCSAIGRADQGSCGPPSILNTCSSLKLRTEACGYMSFVRPQKYSCNEVIKHLEQDLQPIFAISNKSGMPTKKLLRYLAFIETVVRMFEHLNQMTISGHSSNADFKVRPMKNTLPQSSTLLNWCVVHTNHCMQVHTQTWERKKIGNIDHVAFQQKIRGFTLVFWIQIRVALQLTTTPDLWSLSMSIPRPVFEHILQHAPVQRVYCTDCTLEIGHQRHIPTRQIVSPKFQPTFTNTHKSAIHAATKHLNQKMSHHHWRKFGIGI